MNQRRDALIRSLQAGLLLVSRAAACVPAGAVQAEAAKPVRIVVGFPPGQATDQVARVLADGLAAPGRSWIVENKPGQGGSLAPARSRVLRATGA